MPKKIKPSTAPLWARFRFSVVGGLLSSPPARGMLKEALQSLAEKTWTHPVSGRDVRFSFVTIERWFYKARQERDDPIGVLRRTVRKDRGKVSLAPALIEQLSFQYKEYKHWTYQLHYDNLAAQVKTDSSLGPIRSYSTVRRYMQAHGMVRKPRPAPKGRPGEARAAHRRQSREIRSYEVEYVGSLWHLDFHHGSRKILSHEGEWQYVLALGILDDHSRLCCHLQWYVSETAEDLIHGLSQAIQKRGLPRALLTDNGPAMVAEETTEGLERLSIVHERTLPYSPYQNGKQESFWGNLEGRLMEMLDGMENLTLDFLNEATQAWVEIEYNRTRHREIGCSPVERFAKAPDVLRESPSTDALRAAFRLETSRRQRQSDGTISLAGVRLEIPARYRHFRDVTVRYARWDLGRIDLVDPTSGTILTPIYPLDRRANADGHRKAVDSEAGDEPEAGVEPEAGDESEADDDSDASDKPTGIGQRSDNGLPPLLKKILQEYSATGTPPAYLPKRPRPKKGKKS